MSKLLIADDESHIRKLLEMNLESLEDDDVEILMAKNGKEALDIILAEKPNIVLLDVMMPEIDGFEVCRRTKIDNNLKDIFIIMLTAKGQDLDFQKGNEVGANLYITKPFNTDEILEKVKEVLNIE